MQGVLTSRAMRAVEAAAMASGKVSGADLMERAGSGALAVMLAHWPGLAQGGRRAAVLCGPGGNGGDGLVLARLLAARGWRVEVFLAGGAARLSPDCRVMLDRWLGAGGQVQAALPQALVGYDLVIDALFGIGLRRAIVPQIAQLFETRLPGRVVSLDLPSGICADSGRALGAGWVRADLTLAFHRAKPGHYLAEGPGACGTLEVVDIGLDDFARPEDEIPLAAARPEDLAKANPAHKFHHGHALVISGGAGQGGAARLAARAALRIGAGLVTIGAPPGALGEHAARLDAILLRPLAGGGDLAGLLQDRRINALCLGPGMGTGAAQEALLAAALDAQGPRPLVLDADALTILSRCPHLRQRLHPGVVLTPHGGEFARLFPAIAARLAAPAVTGPGFSKLDAAAEAAAEVGAVVVLKGADTVIAGPSGRLALHAAAYGRSAPWLASAGSGDVLAGLICGLLARGLAPFEAACSAVWLHVESALAFGPGLIAEDIPETLPRVLARLMGAPRDQALTSAGVQPSSNPPT